MKVAYIAAGTLAFAGAASAAEVSTRSEPARGDDGVYGRFDGDFAFSIGPDVVIDPTPGAVRLGATAKANFYQTVGLSLGYEQRLPEASGIERAAGLRLHVSPLFLLRFQRNLEQGPSILDLFVDSLELFGGPIFLEPPGGSFAAQVGADVGIGCGLPLSHGATGFWLHPSFVVRFANDSPSALVGLALRYQFFIESPIVGE